ncbi:MAG: hypothetical protein HY049_13590 [Acidobacteria bacterium]|nr:hypothetical protein [Acidobacteriota bacterium]
MLEKGYVGRAIQIIATNPFEFILAGAILGGFSIFTCGLLTGPAAGGLVAMTLKRCRGEEIDIADAFLGFENFTTNLLVGLALMGMVLFGSIFLFVPGWILGALFLYSIPVAVDRGVGPGEALKIARTLGAKDLLAQTIFAAAVFIVAISGAVFLVVGVWISVPIAIGAVTIAYHDAAYPPNTAHGAADI